MQFSVLAILATCATFVYANPLNARQTVQCVTGTLTVGTETIDIDTCSTIGETCTVNMAIPVPSGLPTTLNTGVSTINPAYIDETDSLLSKDLCLRANDAVLSTVYLESSCVLGRGWGGPPHSNKYLEYLEFILK